MKDPGVMFVPVDAFIEGHGWRVSIVWADEAGHFPTGDWPYEGTPSQKMPWFVPGPSWKEADAQVDAMNLERGIDKLQSTKIVTASMALAHRGPDRKRKREGR